MQSLLVQMPNLGLNANFPVNMLDPRMAAFGSQNVFYEYGLASTVYGFAKFDMSSALNSGDTVLQVFQYTEFDRTTHEIAVTTEKIYDHDRINEEWDDITQTGVTMNSNITRPVSYAEMGHDDTNIYYDDDATKAICYHHLIICDGGLSNIQRWAGKYDADCADLTGGDGYHDGTTHRALQVSVSEKNRLLLISPYDYSTSSASWVPNRQMVRWPVINKIQTWTGTGSGYATLYDTGGINVWSAPLGGQHIIYQTKGIWTLKYVGGTTVFDPEPFIPDIGLLSHHLLVNHNNVHYFVGTDYNVYAYYGGSVKKSIGDDIHKFLQDDLDTDYSYRCWMAMGPLSKRLWIFYVPTGSTYITKAYAMDMFTNKWMVRDFSSKWTSGGITAVNMVAADAYIIGETYQEALDTLSTVDISDGGDATIRYGDMLLDTSRSITKDYTAGTWTAGGFDYSKAAEGFTADFTDNDLMVVFDGSNATNTRYGTHYYTVYDVSANGFSVYGSSDLSTSGDHGIADNSTNVPADLSVSGADTIGFYSVCSFDDPGQTYNQVLQEIKTVDRFVMGDSGGFIYQFDSDYTSDDGNTIDSRHLTPVIDLNQPDSYKRWYKLSYTAKGDAVNVRWRTSNFDTTETGWTDQTQALSSSWTEYDRRINTRGKRIQFAFDDFSGGSFDLREFVLTFDVQRDR